MHRSCRDGDGVVVLGRDEMGFEKHGVRCENWREGRGGGAWR